MLPLRVWVHCPRASNGLLPPRSYLVGYMRWHAWSDSGFIPPSDNHSNSFQFSVRRSATLTLDYFRPVRDTPRIVSKPVPGRANVGGFVAAALVSRTWLLLHDRWPPW